MYETELLIFAKKIDQLIVERHEQHQTDLIYDCSQTLFLIFFLISLVCIGKFEVVVS
jgi:hypothetical protein